jgi:hypothetical protein
MDFLHIALSPNLLEESRWELERERERQRQIQEARAARRAERPSRLATLTARLSRARQADSSRPAVAGC